MVNAEYLKQKLDEFEAYGEFDTYAVIKFIDDFLGYVRGNTNNMTSVLPVGSNELACYTSAISNFLELFCDITENSELLSLDELGDRMALMSIYTDRDRHKRFEAVLEEYVNKRNNG